MSSLFPNSEMRNYYTLMGEISCESIAPVIEWIHYQNSCEAKFDQLHLLITSDGGDVAPAMALIDAILGSNIPITTWGLGSIYSAGFFIFLAGDERIVTPRTSLMCHTFWSASEGTYHDHRNIAAENERFHQRLINMIVDRTSINARIAKSRLVGLSDAWVSPDEALQMKICTQVLPGVDYSTFVSIDEASSI